MQVFTMKVGLLERSSIKLLAQLAFPIFRSLSDDLQWLPQKSTAVSGRLWSLSAGVAFKALGSHCWAPRSLLPVRISGLRPE